jgi:DNA repair exonuclease SbcCD ATPase subunit
MPKNENVIQFSLNTEQREKLKAIAIGDESIGLIAKRILLEAIGQETKPSQPVNRTYLDEAIDWIENLEKKIDSIEVAIDCEHFPETTVSYRLTALEQKVKSLESDRDEREATESITVDEISARVDMDVSNLSDRLTAIEAALADFQKQINQATSPVKRPTSPPPPPPGSRSRKK